VDRIGRFLVIKFSREWLIRAWVAIRTVGGLLKAQNQLLAALDHPRIPSSKRGKPFAALVLTPSAISDFGAELFHESHTLPTDIALKLNHQMRFHAHHPRSTFSVMDQRLDPGGSCPKCGEQFIHRRCLDCGPFPPLRLATFLIGFAILGAFVERPTNLGVPPFEPALAPIASNEAAKIGEAAPVLHVSESTAPIEDGAAIVHGAENITRSKDDTTSGMKTAKEFVPGAEEEVKRGTRRPLTIEEKAAVDRGIRELGELRLELNPNTADAR